jgi:hypothetical protein
VAEGNGLLNRHSGNTAIEGSNPSLSSKPRAEFVLRRSRVVAKLSQIFLILHP